MPWALNCCQRYKTTEEIGRRSISLSPSFTFDKHSFSVQQPFPCNTHCSISLSLESLAFSSKFNPSFIMLSRTAIIIGFAAFAALIQPTPAPPLAIAAAGVALGAGAATAGAAAAGLKRRDQGPPGGQGAGAGVSSLQQCLDDSATTSSLPSMTFSGSNTVTISGMPQSCYDAINEYNQYNDIGTLNSLYGSASVQGDGIALSQVPDYVMQNAYAFWGSSAATGGPAPSSPKTGPSGAHWSRRSY